MSKEYIDKSDYNTLVFDKHNTDYAKKISASTKTYKEASEEEIEDYLATIPSVLIERRIAKELKQNFIILKRKQ